MYSTLKQEKEKTEISTGRYFWALLLPLASGKTEPLVEGCHDLYKSVEDYEKGLIAELPQWKSALILEKNEVTEDLVMLKISTGYTVFLRRVYVNNYWVDRILYGVVKNEEIAISVFDGGGWVI